MCNATLLPDPDSPLTRMSLMEFSLSSPGSSAVRPARFGGVVVGLHLLVLDDTPIELVGEQVDGGVHVFLGGFGVHGIAAHMQSGFGLLSELLNCQHAMHVDNVVEMTRNPLE